MITCNICYKNIEKENIVEWLICVDENYKYILGKYKWVECNYCFDCLNISKKLLWRLYINLLLSIDCKNTLAKVLQLNIPIWLTDNLTLEGKPIRALYYQNKMHSGHLHTGLNDFQYYKLQEMIKKLKNDINNYNPTNNLSQLLANLQM